MHRQRHSFRPRRTGHCSFALAVLLCVSAGAAHAQNYPLLEDLNRQTQSLYRDVQAGLVRVQLPPPNWVRAAAVREDPLRKWGKVVDPVVKRNLEEQREQALRGSAPRLNVIISPTTRPAAVAPRRDGSALSDTWGITPGPTPREVMLESRGDVGGASSIVIHSGGEAAGNGQINTGGVLRLTTQPTGSDFAPNNIGLLLDDAGHVLVPLFIERETIGDAPVRVMVQDVQTTARFVGSDEKMQVTVLKMERMVGRPVRMGSGRPEEGALVMMLNPNSGSGRLALWTGGEKDYGVVVAMDGTVAGLVRYGQFLGGPASKPVIDQLIRVGSVQRAILGVRLTEVRIHEAAAQKALVLAGRPALLVDEVTSGSLAERSGLKRGDYIIELGGQVVGDLTTWAALTARMGPTRLVVLRDGKRTELTVDLQPAR